jgi:DnaK suppressor protein
MNDATASARLSEERTRVETLLGETTRAASSDRSAANDAGSFDHAAERLTAEEGDDAIAASLRARLDAITRAEARVADGTFGRSVRSGAPIDEERLEADPAAELTTEEARTGEPPI